MRETASREYKNLNRIPGWFSFHDFLAFRYLLQNQSAQGFSGDCLEIGAYQGKSAIAIGLQMLPNEALHVCDLFGNPSDARNSLEIRNSYTSIDRDIFEKNYFSYNLKSPVIHQYSSLELNQTLESNLFRFIHIDGSHLYEIVREDLDFAMNHLINGGIIAIDDIRSPHTFGVAIASWDIVSKGLAIPILLTPTKLYLMNNYSLLDLDNFENYFQQYGVETNLENFKTNNFIRTSLHPSESLYQMKLAKKDFIPPVLLRILKRR